jgi:hypothetical protein
MSEWFDLAVEELAGIPAAAREAHLTRLKKAAVLAANPENAIEKPPVRTVAEYLAADLGMPPMLVGPGQIARGAVTALISRGGKGKTTMTLNRIARWSVGKPMFGDLPDVMAPVDGPIRSLVIENEGSPGFFQDRLRLLLDSQDFTDDEREMAGQNILIWGDGGWPRIKLDDPDTVDLVRRGIEEHHPDLVMLDTFRSLHRGAENSSDEMQQILDTVTTLAAEYGAGVLLIHHENKTPLEGDQMSAARGSTVLEDDVAVMERYSPVRGVQSEIKWVKTRFMKPAAPVRMEFDFDTWTYRYVPEAEGRREILDILARNAGHPLAVRDIAEELGESVEHTRRLLRDLEEDDDTDVKRLPSVASGDGSSGQRYQLDTGDGNGERLSF